MQRENYGARLKPYIRVTLTKLKENKFASKLGSLRM